MGKLTVETDIAFETKGIVVQKGRKKETLIGKSADERVAKDKTVLPSLLLIHIDPEDGCSRMSFPLGKEHLMSGELNIEYDPQKSGFNVSSKGTFEIKVADGFVTQFKSEGKKLLFRIKGVTLGEGPAVGGYLSHHTSFDSDKDNYKVCPAVKVKPE